VTDHATTPIVPAPPHAAGVGLPWDVGVDDAVGAVAAARRRHGDTFTLASGDDTYLFTFSPTGVAAFYALPEDVASKGVADYLMLRRKLPDELFVGRRTLPHQLFTRDVTADVLAHLERALDATVAELGPAGTVDVFALGRRIGHRVGLAAWGGPGAADGDRFDRLVAAFDALDGSDAFVHPDAMAAVAATGRARERAALEVVVAELAPAASADAGADPTLFGSVARRWSDAPSADAARGTALDVALVHVASLTNLVAAMGWYVVDLLGHPDAVAAVRAGDRGAAERAALESIRLAQRSIMTRRVLRPLSLDVGDAVYDVPAGVSVATLLPLTNTEGTGYGEFRPDRWRGRRLADASDLGARELVTTFGHGPHTCPAQPFSLAAMSRTARRLFDSYDVEPRWATRPVPLPAQIGGVARPSGPCEVAYRLRA
jgi:cytochrome P450